MSPSTSHLVKSALRSPHERLCRLYARRGEFDKLREQILSKSAAQIPTPWERAKGWLYGRGDQAGSGMGWTLSELPVLAAGLGYRAGIFGPATARAGDEGMNKALRARLAEAGVKVRRATHDHFNPGEAAIGLRRPNTSHTGILAHEAGHALGPIAKSKLGLLAYGIGRPSLFGGVLGTAFASDEMSGGANALMGTLGAVPMLAEELRASGAGYRMMRDLGAARRSALGSFIGLPTYLLSASSPLVMHAAKKHFNGYES